MNFFRRRKILRQVNFLEMHPVRVFDHELRENGNVSILMPRFKNPIGAKLFQPRTKPMHIPIKLDKYGSVIWLLCNRVNNVDTICRKLEEQFPEELSSKDETEERVTKFLSLIYQQRYISFIEIQDEPTSNK